MSSRVFAESLACLLLALTVPTANAQFTTTQFQIKYICRSEGRYWTAYNGGEKHYCWEGKHYSKSTGGVPTFITDYWAEKERESARLREELKQNREEMIAKHAAAEAALEESRRAAGLPSVAEARRASSERHQAAIERMRGRAGSTGSF